MIFLGVRNIMIFFRENLWVILWDDLVIDIDRLVECVNKFYFIK